MSLVVLERGHGVNVRNWDRIKEVWNMMSGNNLDFIDVVLKEIWVNNKNDVGSTKMVFSQS
jgi:hypothetical protein